MAPVNLNIPLDRDSEEPIYRQLIRYVRMQVESGMLPAGTRLPASRDLAQQLHISRISVVNAYAELRSDGFLSAHAGRGTFVAKDGNAPSNERMFNESMSMSRKMDSTDYSIRDMMRLARRAGVINFSHGSPPKEFFPVQQLREALNIVLERDGPDALSYEVPEGYSPLRVAVRDYVSALGIQCRANQVLITGGAQQGIDLVLQALLSEGDTVVTAMPTYLGVIDIARARRVQIHTIASDDDGIRIDCLEQYILEHHPKLIYVMPSFQNPTGRVMPIHRRRQLLNVANEYHVPVLEDAVYTEFRFEGEALPPLKALDDNGIVIHTGAFTKMLLPGMRIGYLITDGQHYDRLVRVKQAADISTPGLNQRAIHWMLARGILAQQLERNNRELKRRRDTALLAAEKYLPPGTHWSIPQGGLYLWAELPHTGPTATELFISAMQMDVAFAVGNLFFPNGGGSYYMRLNYGLQQPDKIMEGFRRLGRAWHDLACDYDEMEKTPVL